MKKTILFIIVFTSLVALSSTVFAAVKIDGLIVSSSSENTCVVEVYFSGTAPFKLYKSLDGQTWGEPLATGITASSYAYNDAQNYVNLFFKIEDNDGSSAITTAFPPNRNPHGSFAINSSFCAACHVTHAADGSYLLAAPNVVALCTTCHDGTQSKYDVRNGTVSLSSGPQPASGGPFGPLQTELSVETAVYAGFESISSQTVENSPTSIHNLGVRLADSPGGVSNIEDGLSCTDCHDAHGNGNFRNLKTRIFVTPELSSTINFQAFAQTDLTGASEYGEKIYYKEGSINFCSVCHSDYNQASGSGSIATTTTQQTGFPISDSSRNTYMHAVNTPLIWRNQYLTTGLPMEYGTGTNVIVCLTCHQAHGTLKVGVSKKTESTALIRMDRQAVCQECHKK